MFLTNISRKVAIAELHVSASTSGRETVYIPEKGLARTMYLFDDNGVTEHKLDELNEYFKFLQERDVWIFIDESPHRIFRAKTVLDFIVLAASPAIQAASGTGKSSFPGMVVLCKTCTSGRTSWRPGKFPYIF